MMLRRAAFASSIVLAITSCSRPEPSRAIADAATDAADAASRAATEPADEPPPSPRPTARPVRDAAVLPVAAWVWKPYRGDGFTITMPGEPKVTELPPDDDRVGFTEAKVDVPGGQVTFAAGFSDYPAEEIGKPDTFLDDHVTAPRRGLTEVLTKRSITLPTGEPGRVLILRRNISGTPLRVYSRIYLVKRRLYSLIVSTLDEGGVGEDVVKRFMDSFRLG